MFFKVITPILSLLALFTNITLAMDGPSTQYGGEFGRSTFAARSPEIVEKAASDIEKLLTLAERTGRPLNELHPIMVGSLAKERARIASETGSRDVERFGLSRMDPAAPNVHITGFHGRDELVSVLSHQVRGLLETIIDTEEDHITSDGFEVQLLRQGHESWPLMTAEEQLAQQILAMQGDLEAQQLLSRYAAIRGLFANVGGDMERIDRLQREGSLMLIRYGIKDEDTPLTEFYCLVEQDMAQPNRLSAEHLETICSSDIGQVLHTSSRLIEALAEKASREWACILELDAEDERLKERIAKLRWYESQAMRFCRGSAAITNWQVAALLKRLHLREDTVWGEIDYHSLALPQELFVTQYCENVELTELEEGVLEE